MNHVEESELRFGAEMVVAKSIPSHYWTVDYARPRWNAVLPIGDDIPDDDCASITAVVMIPHLGQPRNSLAGCDCRVLCTEIARSGEAALRIGSTCMYMPLLRCVSWIFAVPETASVKNNQSR